MCNIISHFGGLLFEGDCSLKSIGEYFISLSATAMIGVLVTSLISDQRIRNVFRIVTGILLLLVLLKPIAQIDLSHFGQEIGSTFRQEFTTQDYESLYQEKLCDQVRRTTEEYIRKKAESLGITITAKVELSTDHYPTPTGVKIYGEISPEQMTQLQAYIAQELGIPNENQRWEFYE